MPTLLLPTALTIDTAAHVHGRVLHWTQAAAAADAADTTWHIDASAVDDIDAAGVQLLLALLRTASRDNRRVTLQAPSGALQDLLRDLGLTQLLVTESH